MNNIILNKNADKPVIEMSGSDERHLTSKGYNLVGGTIIPVSTNKFTTSEFDKYNSMISSLNVVWDANRSVYTWDGNVNEFTRLLLMLLRMRSQLALNRIVVLSRI